MYGRERPQKRNPDFHPGLDSFAGVAELVDALA